MAVVSAKKMLLKATEGKYAVGAFNVTNIVQMKAVIEAAQGKRAPLILQTSVAPVRFLGVKVLVAAYRALAEAASVPICLHLDHCTDVTLCKAAADAGYTNIMIDASKEEFEANVRVTKAVTDYCHALGDVTVEGELGTVCGVEDQIKVTEDEAALCDPGKAEEFVRRSGIDLFAPAIGTAHGVYKTKNPKLHFDLLQEVFKVLNGTEPTVPLVIHGGTGLQDDVVRRLVACGGCKFNVSTELKHTLIDATYGYISTHRDEYNPGRLDDAVSRATIQMVERWIDVLGCAGEGRVRRTMPEIKAIFFDQDGVIVDTERDGHRVAFNRAFESFGFDVRWDVPKYHEMLQVGGGKERMRHQLRTGGFGREIPPDQEDALIAQLHQCKTDIFIEMIERRQLPLRPGVHRLMQEACRRGLMLGVCTTSAERAARSILEGLLADMHFDLVLAGDVVKRKKPDPEIYLLALEKTGLRPERCVVVEDSSNGVKAAKAAGMNVVATVNDYTRDEDLSLADIVLSCLGDEDGPQAELIRSRKPWKIDGIIRVTDLVDYFQ